MTMSNTQQKPKEQAADSKSQPKVGKPNEKGNVTVQAHVKIFDPQTKQVYVEGRA